MSRKQSREVAFRLLFQLGFGVAVDIQGGFELASDGVAVDERERGYIETLVTAVAGNLEHIDKMIGETAKGFSFDRIFRVDLCALRLAVGELLYLPDTPRVVAVNEAVHLAKKYGTDKSGGYVNGVLASILARVNNE